MRLPEYYKQEIKNAVAHYFGGTAKVFLFGSRVDDNKLGGDIDLLIITSYKEELALEKVNLCYAQLQQLLGEQKIDIIVLASDTMKTDIHREALAHGVLL